MNAKGAKICRTMNNQKTFRAWPLFPPFSATVGSEAYAYWAYHLVLLPERAGL
jgi:hypothetical protein